mgnify:CR=1
MSTLLADTIRKTGGTAGTDIKVNNSSTYVDGSNKSQNMVAAISKFWLNFSMAGTTARSDSLNNSGITDNGTGDFTLAFTNNFNYNGYCITYCLGGHDASDGHWDYDGGTYVVATGSVQVKSFTQGSSIASRDTVNNNWSAKGDLA